MSAVIAPLLHGEIESPRPLRATDGRIKLTGWCLCAGETSAPAVRLVTTGGTLALTTRTTRADVPKLLPAEPAASQCGFTIEGQLPAGVYLAHGEAQLPDATWQVFKTLSLVVEPAAFAAGIESPAKTKHLSKRQHIEGWALDPAQRVTDLVLRYGHQEIPCVLGGRRPDLN